MKEIVKKTKKVLKADIVILYQYDSDNVTYENIPIAEGVFYDKQALYHPGSEDDVLSRISKRDSPCFASQVSNDPIMDHRFVERESIISAAGIPLKVVDKLVGVLFVNFRQQYSFTEENKNFIKMLGTIASFTINRVQIQKKQLKEEKLAALGTQAAELMHSIINPIGIIKKVIENTKDKEDIGKERLSKALEKISKNADRIINIKDRVLSVSYFSRKKEKVNINYEIGCVLNLLKDEGIIGKDVYIKYDYYEDLPELLLDPDEMKEVFLAIIRNSLDSMINGGLLFVSTRFYKKEQLIEIVIKDTGCGIPRNISDKIFEPFVTTDHINRTGLGLSTSYRIIKNYGGNVSFESKEKKGTTFKIVIPLNIHTVGKESVSYADDFLNNTFGYNISNDKVIILKDDYENVLRESKKLLKQVSKRIEEDLEHDFNTARNILYRRGDNVRIDAGNMVIGNHIINNNFEIVEEITSELKDAKATIFQLIGKEAVRISTNELDHNGKKAINTVVSSLVYKCVVESKRIFRGRAWVVKGWKIARYEPMYDKHGKMIGVFYIGIPEKHPKIIDSLQEKISTIKFREVGYLFVLDGEGKVIYHPDLITDYDLSQYGFFEKYEEKRTGWLNATYQIKNCTKKEIIRFQQYWDLGWTLCAAYPVEEVKRLVREDAR